LFYVFPINLSHLLSSIAKSELFRGDFRYLATNIPMTLPRPRAYASDDGVGEADRAAARVPVVRKNVQPGGERSAAAATAAAAKTAAAKTAATANAATAAANAAANAFSRAEAEMLL
jgi:hypothetical protein